MRYISVLPALATTTLATVYQVAVGPGYVYDPETITGAVAGDVISFTFGQGHNVVSGAFNDPCQPSGNIYSGNPSNGDVFSVTMNDSSPLWIYCSVPGHCQGGMVMAVNPPSGQTVADYKSTAANVFNSNEPSTVGGGVFGAAAAASSVAASSSAAASSASSSAASASSSASAAASSVSSSASSAASMAASSASASGNNAAATGAPAAILAAAGLLAFL